MAAIGFTVVTFVLLAITHSFAVAVVGLAIAGISLSAWSQMKRSGR